MHYHLKGIIIVRNLIINLQLSTNCTKEITKHKHMVTIHKKPMS